MELAGSTGAFHEMGAEVVALSMDDLEDAARMVQLAGASFPVLSDPEGTVVKMYGVYDLLGDGVSAPATFIIDRDGTVLWRQIGQNIADRPDTATLLDVLSRMVTS